MGKIARIKSDVQLQSWAQMELARQDSGLTVSDWCRREQISKSAYYYRLRKVREMICEQVAVPVADIYAVNPERSTAIRITCGDIVIEIADETPEETTTAIIQALKC